MGPCQEPRKWNRQFLLDLFGTAQTLVPGVAGAMFLIGSLGVRDGGWMVGCGICLLGLGAVLGFTRLVTEGDKLYLQQVERENAQKVLRENAEIDRVASLIAYDTDRRTREFLKELRTLKIAFEHATSQEGTAFRDTFATLFWKSVAQIERAHTLLLTARDMKHKDGVLATRAQCLDAVAENLVTLRSTFEGLTTLSIKADVGGEDELRRALEAKLHVAEAVDREMDGFNPSLEKYLK